MTSSLHISATSSTGNLHNTWQHYAPNQPGLSQEACALFAERQIRAIGSDTIACDTPVKDGYEYFSYGHHDSFLPNEIFIMEMLMNLEKLPRRCYFMAIPLKIKNGSGSPIRPFAILGMSKPYNRKYTDKENDYETEKAIHCGL